MHTSVTFIDTDGIQRTILNVRLVTPTGHVTGSGSLTLWLREAKRNRYFQHSATFHESDIADGTCASILARVGQ